MSRVTLNLRLELDRDAISGEVGSNGGPPHRFSGYAGLIAALESIRAELCDGPDPGSGRARLRIRARRGRDGRCGPGVGGARS